MGLFSVFEMFEKLDDIIYAPIKLVTDWAGEPLKIIEEGRQRKLKKLESEIRKDEAEHDVKLQIERETEVVRIIAEIEEMKKEKGFERMKAVSESVMQFQQDLTKLNNDAINAIGNMQLELREKAQNLVYQKTIQYKNLQDLAMQEAMRELKKIEKDFADNEAAKTILIKNVDKMLSNVIDTAHNFLLGLNDDIKGLNGSIDLLAKSGQGFIEGHLNQFHALGVSETTIRELKSAEY